MDLLPDPEQREIVAATRTFLEAELPLSRLQSDPGLDDDTWRTLAELGWLGLGLDGERGGVGYGLAEETLLFVELGRFLLPTSLLAAALAARVASAAGDADTARAIVDGRRRVALAEARDTPAAAIGPRVSGRFWMLDGAGAELLLVCDAGGGALLDAGALGAAEPRPSLDEATGLAALESDGAEALAFVPAAAEPVWLRGALLASAMLVGIAEAARDAGSAYASERRQFGKPIGVFQAVKHRCADMAVRAEAARSLLLYAALALRDGRADAASQVSAAKARAGEAALENARANIQIHGGYGFTVEYDAHFYLKRCHVLNRVMGTPRDHLAALIAGPASESEASESLGDPGGPTDGPASDPSPGRRDPRAG